MSDSQVNEPHGQAIDLEARVRSMARQVAWLKSLVLVLAVSQAALMASFAGMAALMLRPGRAPTAADQILRRVRTHRLEVADSRGRPIATVGEGAPGSAEIRLSGTAGRSVVVSADRNGEAVLALRDSRGVSRAEIGLDSGGTARLRLANAAGSNSAVLTAHPKAGARLDLCDGSGRSRASLLTAADGHPGLAMAHSDGRRRAALFVDTTGTAGLAISDKVGRSRVIAPR